MMGPMVAVIDAHTHVASEDEARHPRRLGGFGSAWHASGGHGVENLLATMDAAGVERAVVVQAVGVYGEDHSCAIDAVAAAPDRLALVVAPGMHDDPLGAVTALVQQAPIAGVRLFGVDRRPLDWLTDGRAGELFDLARAERWTLVPTLFPDALDALGTIAAAHPDVPVALDHCGFPDLDGGPPFRGAGALFALAGVPNVHLKISTHLLEDAQRSADPAALVDLLAERFGGARLCWGSDHPQSEALDYPAKLAFARRAARHLPTADHDALFAKTSSRLWFGES